MVQLLAAPDQPGGVVTTIVPVHPIRVVIAIWGSRVVSKRKASPKGEGRLVAHKRKAQ